MSRPVRTGEVIRLGRAASVQFSGAPIVFRVTRVHEWPTYSGWVWLDGYQLSKRGAAVARRSVFVKVDGVKRAFRGMPSVHRQDGSTKGA